MTEHQLQLESWDNWDIVYENLIMKHKSSAGFTFSCKYAALCIEMAVCFPPRVLQKASWCASSVVSLGIGRSVGRINWTSGEGNKSLL